MINDKPFLIHVHLRNDNRCYWYSSLTRSKLSDRAECATALDNNGLADMLLLLSIAFGSRLKLIEPFKINTCPMLDELREARK